MAELHDWLLYEIVGELDCTYFIVQNKLRKRKYVLGKTLHNIVGRIFI